MHTSVLSEATYPEAYEEMTMMDKLRSGKEWSLTIKPSSFGFRALIPYRSCPQLFEFGSFAGSFSAELMEINEL